MPSKNKRTLRYWSSIVRDTYPGEAPALPMPLPVLNGEAVDVAKFFEKHWETQVDAGGRVIRIGLESAVPKDVDQGVGRLGPETGADILSLQRATQEAHTRYLLTVDRIRSPRARGELLLAEIRAVLGWYFDDGVEDERDAMLSALDAAHEGDPATNDALAGALDDYAHLGARFRDKLDGLGGFETAYLDEAVEVAAALRERPAQVEVLSAQAREALELRNKLAAHLYDLMGLVRAAARFVYRRQPEIVRGATSAYERRKRAAARRARAARAAAPAPASTSAPASAPAIG